MNTYGVATKTSGYVDTSRTERGAKNHATRNGYNAVFVRFNSGYDTALVAFRTNKGWCDAVVLADWLDYIESEIEKERISYSDLCDLQAMAEHIPQERALLREWAGVPE